MRSKKPFPQDYLETGIPGISILLSSIYYFLDYVFIIISDKDYRLLVIHNNRVLWDKNYKTVRGARISFAKRFKHMAYNLLKTNEWSHCYRPEKEWLRDLLPRGAGDLLN